MPPPPRRYLLLCAPQSVVQQCADQPALPDLRSAAQYEQTVQAICGAEGGASALPQCANCSATTSRPGMVTVQALQSNCPDPLGGSVCVGVARSGPSSLACMLMGCPSHQPRACMPAPPRLLPPTRPPAGTLSSICLSLDASSSPALVANCSTWAAFCASPAGRNFTGLCDSAPAVPAAGAAEAPPGASSSSGTPPTAAPTPCEPDGASCSVLFAHARRALAPTKTTNITLLRLPLFCPPASACSRQRSRPRARPELLRRPAAARVRLLPAGRRRLGLGHPAAVPCHTRPRGLRPVAAVHQRGRCGGGHGGRVEWREGGVVGMSVCYSLPCALKAQVVRNSRSPTPPPPPCMRPARFTAASGSYCQPFSVLGSICRDAASQAGCQRWSALCGTAGTVVQQCMTGAVRGVPGSRAVRC